MPYISLWHWLVFLAVAILMFQGGSYFRRDRSACRWRLLFHYPAYGCFQPDDREWAEIRRVSVASIESGGVLSRLLGGLVSAIVRA
jgi:hypothetical protein